MKKNKKISDLGSTKSQEKWEPVTPNTKPGIPRINTKWAPNPGNPRSITNNRISLPNYRSYMQVFNPPPRLPVVWDS